MGRIDVSFRIGGEAGQGVESSGAGFVKALARAGLHAIGVADYYSRIRGGHNFFTVRVSDRPVWAVRDRVQLLLALNAETVTRHLDSMSPGGAIIVDEEVAVDAQAVSRRDVRLLRPPLVALAKREGSELMANTAALAYVAGLVSFDLRYIMQVIEDNFARKGAEVVEANRRVAQAAFEMATDARSQGLAWEVRGGQAPPRLTVNGNQAFALGALMGGCKFVAGYPMTPASSVLEYMAQHSAEWGIVTKHAESELAAVNMCVGAAHMGARAMAPTSGGGFDLMTEGVSLAAMIEAPLVIYLAQRPGPATGLATRTAQTELRLALGAAHGEFPRIVMAPHSPQEMFRCGARAFNLAEKYQCLVVVLSDQYTASTFHTVPVDAFPLDEVQIDRGKLLSEQELDAMDAYVRHADAPDGVSPRALPGFGPKSVYFTTSDTHRADGHIDEDADVAVWLQDKLLRKQQAAAAEMRAPLREGPEEADLTLVSWGSTYGAVREALELLAERGQRANMVHFVDLWPFPVAEAREALGSAGRIVCVEGNATGQLAFLLQAHAGIAAHGHVRKYDGRGFTPDYILGRLEAG